MKLLLSFLRGKKQWIFSVCICLFYLLLVGSSLTLAQSSCSPAQPSVMMQWNFDKGYDCGKNSTYPSNPFSTTPKLNSWEGYYYCPNINSGCGTGILGSKGHVNTNLFANALCLSGFYLTHYIESEGKTVKGYYDPASTVFNVESPINIYVKYKIPQGTIGCLSSFALNVIQSQYNGRTPNFEKQGVAVKRNGVLIYNTTQPIAAANVNGKPLSFSFTGSDFCSDGTADVEYQIIFGLVHQFNIPAGQAGAEARTGYDNITINGTCGVSSPISATATAASCGITGPLTDAQLKVAGFAATDKYDYTPGTTYTGGQTYATATGIPSTGIIVNNLPDPGTPKVYTVRIFNANGCTQDIQVTLNPAICPIACAQPASMTLTPITATCSGTIASSNAKIVVTGVTGGDRVGISVGTSYTAVSYSLASPLTSGAYSFTGLPNPLGSQIYTVRIFNGSDNCYIDKTVELLDGGCDPCATACAQVLQTGAADPTTNDYTACYVSCKTQQYIDLKLTKSVSPNTGTTCPVSTTFVWTVSVTNAGNMTATQVTIADHLPTDMIVVSSSATQGSFVNDGGWFVGNLAPGQTESLYILAQATKPGVFTNCAEVQEALPHNDPNSTPGNHVTTEDDYACSSIIVTSGVGGGATPTISKSFAPTGTRPNLPVQMTIQIVNNNSTPIVLTQNLIDTLPALPAQMVVSATPNLVTGNIPVVAAAGTNTVLIPKGTPIPAGLTQIKVDVVAPQEGLYCNVINAGALQTSSCNNIESTTACLSVSNDFVSAPVVNKSFVPSTLEVNQIGQLIIAIQNRDVSDFTSGRDFVDYFPAGLVVAGTATSTCGTVSAVIGEATATLLSGSVIHPGSCTITVPVKSVIAGTYCNEIPMNSLGGTIRGVMSGNENVSDACLTVVNSPVFDLALTKTLTSGQSRTVTAGSSVTFTVTVFNQGSVDATSAQVTDYIPAGLTLNDPNWTANGTQATLNTPIANLAAGQSTTRNIVFTVNSTATGSLTNTAEISSESNTQNLLDTDSTPDNDPTNDGTALNDDTSGDHKHYPNQDEDDSDPEEIIVTPKACLGDYVWLDTNQNGVQDASETGVASVTAVLYDAVSGTVVSTTVTDGTGHYQFCNLNPGQYYVKFTAPTGTTFTTPNSGGDDTKDSDVSSLTGQSGTTPVVSLTAGENNPTIDAGLVPQKACLGDYVWLDTNQNGVQDASETGVASVTAVLYDAVSGTVVSTTVTDGTGHYQFCNLNPGSYYVKFTAPTGTTFTTPNSGGNNTTDSNVTSTTGQSGTTPVVSLTAGENNPTIDAGLVPQKACLGDYVWLDTNQNGVQDASETGVASVTAVLYDAVSGTVVSTTVTDGTGHYQFCNLNPGQYYVKFTAPTGTTFTTPNSGGNNTTDSNVTSTTGQSGTTPVISLTAGQNDPTIDAGLVPLKACLGDYVWYDNNKNGQQDAGEPGAVGVTVTLYNATTSQPVSTTVTDGTGHYLFCNLDAGTYYVVFTAPSGATFTTVNSGNDTTDSDAGVGGKTGNYTLVGGQQDLTVDAGLVPQCTSPNCTTNITVK